MPFSTLHLLLVLHAFDLLFSCSGNFFLFLFFFYLRKVRNLCCLLYCFSPFVFSVIRRSRKCFLLTVNLHYCMLSYSKSDTRFTYDSFIYIYIHFW